MELDSRTRNELDTVAIQLLKATNEEIANKFIEAAFSDEQSREKALTTLNSVGDRYLIDLIKKKSPHTTYQSAIYNVIKFREEKENKQKFQQNVIEKRIKSINLNSRLIGHIEPVSCLCIDPSGNFMFSASNDSNIKAWHIPSLSAMTTFKGHKLSVTQVEISPDRRLLGSASVDNCFRLWSLETEECVYNLDTESEINSFCFSPTNDLVLIGTEAGAAMIIKIGEAIHDLYDPKREEDSYPNCDDFMHFCSYDPHIFLTDAPKTIWTTNFKRASVECVNFSLGGYFYGIGLNDGMVLIDCIDHKRKWSWKAHDGSVDDIHFMNNNQHTVLTMSRKCTEIKLWSLYNIEAPIREFTIDSRLARKHFIDLCLSCDENILFANTSVSIYAWCIESGELIYQYESKEIITLSAHPKITTICAACTKTVLHIIDVTKKEPIITLEVPVAKNQFACWHPNGLQLFAGDSLGGIYVFRVEKEPECHQYQQFFESDFIDTTWVPGVGEVKNGDEPCKLANTLKKNKLLDQQQNTIIDNYAPVSISEFSGCTIIKPVVIHARINEEKIAQTEITKETETKKKRGRPKKGSAASIEETDNQ